MQLIHHLRPSDYERTLSMVAQFLVKIDDDPSFLSNNLWTDEPRFTNNGILIDIIVIIGQTITLIGRWM